MASAAAPIIQFPPSDTVEDDRNNQSPPQQKWQESRSSMEGPLEISSDSDHDHNAVNGNDLSTFRDIDADDLAILAVHNEVDGKAWLSDTIMDVCIGAVVSLRSDVHFLGNERTKYVLRNCKRNKIRDIALQSQFTRVVCCLRLPGKRWVIFLISKTDGRVMYYDPQNPESPDLQQRASKLGPKLFGARFGNEWSVTPIKAPPNPRQADKVNCGVYCIIVSWFLILAEDCLPTKITPEPWRKILLAFCKGSSMLDVLPDWAKHLDWILTEPGQVNERKDTIGQLRHSYWSESTHLLERVNEQPEATKEQINSLEKYCESVPKLEEYAKAVLESPYLLPTSKSELSKLLKVVEEMRTKVNPLKSTFTTRLELAEQALKRFKKLKMNDALGRMNTVIGQYNQW